MYSILSCLKHRNFQRQKSYEYCLLFTDSFWHCVILWKCLSHFYHCPGEIFVNKFSTEGLANNHSPFCEENLCFCLVYDLCEVGCWFCVSEQWYGVWELSVDKCVQTWCVQFHNCCAFSCYLHLYSASLCKDILHCHCQFQKIIGSGEQFFLFSFW